MHRKTANFVFGRRLMMFVKSNDLFPSVTPAKAGAQSRAEGRIESRRRRAWIPAFAGMTVSGHLEPVNTFSNGSMAAVGARLD